MKKDKKRILIIAAHPDDEVLGCGGIIAKETDNGNNVKVVILATGKSSRYKDKPLNIEIEISELYKESTKAFLV